MRICWGMECKQCSSKLKQEYMLGKMEAYIDKAIMKLQAYEGSHDSGISDEPCCDNTGYYHLNISNPTFSSVKSYL